MQDHKPITPTIVQIVTDRRGRRSEISMIDVAVAAFGLTGVIMVAALVAGLLAGVAVHLVSLAPRHHDHRSARRTSTISSNV